MMSNPNRYYASAPYSSRSVEIVFPEQQTVEHDIRIPGRN